METKKPIRKLSEVSTTTIAIFTVIILLGIMLLSGGQFKPFLESGKTTISEDPIEKNSKLMIRPGEEYVYTYNLENSSFNMTFRVSRGVDCTYLAYMESTSSEACLNEWGNDIIGMNASLSNPLIVMFKPWMLAVDNGWTWRSSMNIAFEGVDKSVLDIYYKVVRIDNYRGRRAYVVRISTADGQDTFFWIDDEKRILLKEMGDGYTMEIISGLPFKD